MHALGIDIGGSGIKAAPVDVTTGKFLTDRQKIATPRPARPDAVAEVVKQLTTSFSWSGPVGITFPGVVIDGVTRTAANLDPAWIGLDSGALFGKATGNPVRVLNDADAAGVAEMTFGAGVGQQGHGADADLRHRDRQRAVHRRRAGAEHRVRAHRGPRSRRGDARVRARQGTARPELGQVGRPGRRVPPAHRGAALAAPDHRGRRDQQAVGEVGAEADRDPGPHRARGAAQRRRDRRRRDGHSTTGTGS